MRTIMICAMVASFAIHLISGFVFVCENKYEPQSGIAKNAMTTMLITIVIMILAGLVAVIM